MTSLMPSIPLESGLALGWDDGWRNMNIYVAFGYRRLMSGFTHKEGYKPI